MPQTHSTTALSLDEKKKKSLFPQRSMHKSHSAHTVWLKRSVIRGWHGPWVNAVVTNLGLAVALNEAEKGRWRSGEICRAQRRREWLCFQVEALGERCFAVWREILFCVWQMQRRNQNRDVGREGSAPSFQSRCRQLSAHGALKFIRRLTNNVGGAGGKGSFAETGEWDGMS